MAHHTEKQEIRSVQNLFRLEGKVAVVTGGYGGIGAPVSQALAAAGAKVAIAGHNEQKAASCAEALRSSGFDSYAFHFDAFSVEDTQRMMDEVAAHYGEVNILVNAVGLQREEKAEDVTEENFDTVIAGNLKAMMFQAQAAARHMIRQGSGGKQIHFGSVRSLLALRGRGFAAYCAAKGGMPILCKQLATEWAEHKINVNLLAPTFVRTQQVAAWLEDPQFYANLVARIPLGRIAEPEDIVGAVLFFATPASGFITGQTLYLDGGVTATQ